MLGYMTEVQLREQVRRSFEEAARADEEAARAAAADGAEYKRRYDTKKFGTPEYEAWIQHCIRRTRTAGRLVTPQQLADLAAKRPLREGDRAKYVGLTRLEPTQSGRRYLREHGEVGRIVSAVKGSDGLHTCVFLRETTPAERDPGGPQVFIARLRFAEGTPGYFLIERVPNVDERPHQDTKSDGLWAQPIDGLEERA